MIEPKKIEPNFFIRWLKKSIILTISNIIPWIVFDILLWLFGLIPFKMLFYPDIFIISLGLMIMIMALNVSLYSNDHINVFKNKEQYTSILWNIVNTVWLNYILLIGLNTFMFIISKGKISLGSDIAVCDYFYWGASILSLSNALWKYFFMCYYQIADENIVSYYMEKCFNLNFSFRLWMPLHFLILSFLLGNSKIIYVLLPLYVNFWFVGFKEVFTENKPKEYVEEKKEEKVTDLALN